MQRNIMICLLVIILIVFNYNIYQKEQINKNGKIILMELAPQDPRSLMQGDYMRLRYKIESNIRPINTKEGFVVISPDNNNIGQFVRLYKKSENLKSTEQLLYFRKKHETAKYGIFKFNNNGEHLLIGLADKNKNTINNKNLEQ